MYKLIRNIIFIFYVLLIFHSTVLSKTIPISKKAVLDLRSWNFEKDGDVKLDGEWAFYWGKLLTSTDFKKGINPDFYIKVPDKWEQYSYHGKNLPINGFATYRLKILINTDRNDLKLSIAYPLQPTVCYINGKKIGYNGVVGKDAKTTNHEYKFYYNSFNATSDTLDVIIQIANYEYERGGLCYTISLGNSNLLDRKTKIQNMIDIFFLGCIFLMSIYHFIIYFLRRKDKSPLFLALFCLGTGIQFAFINNDINSLLTVGLNLKSLLYFSIIPSCIMYAGYLLFVYNLFPKEFTKFGIVVTLIVCLCNYLLYSVSYSSAMYLEQYFRYFRILSLLYSFIVVVIAVIKKRENAILFLVGLSIVVFGAIIDILIQLNILNMPSPLQMGMLGLFLMQAFIVARRFSMAFYRNERLTEELTFINENLESLVFKRTETIEQQNIMLLQLNKTKDRLFAIIGHDLRSPLGSLEGVSDVIDNLVKQQKFERLQQVSEQIEISVKRMTVLLDNLLKWSFLQTKQLIFNPQKLNIYEMVESTLEFIRPLADLKQIKIINKSHSKLYVTADDNLMKTVLRNLISNAVKFTNKHGAIEILSESDETFVNIMIKDTGVGIDVEKSGNIFEINENKISVGTNNEKGTGLGLVLCKEFVEMHNGTITYTTEFGVGTTFYIKLPIL